MTPWQYCNRDFTDADIGSAIGFLYCVYFPNHRRYVGQKTFTAGGWRPYRGSGVEVDEYVAEHGTDNLHRVILELHYDYQELDNAERDLIEVLDAVESELYMNRQYGGGNHKHGPKTLKLMSEYASNRSPEHQAKLTAYAQNMSTSHKANISKSLTGKVPSQATRALWSAQRKGRKCSPSAVAKRAKSNTGKKRSAQAKANIAAGLRKYYANKETKHGISN